MNKIITSGVLAILLLSGCSNNAQSVAEEYVEINQHGEYDDFKSISSKKHKKYLDKKIYECVSRASNQNDSTDLAQDIQKAYSNVKERGSIDNPWGRMDAKKKVLKGIIYSDINENNNYEETRKCKSDFLSSSIEDYEVISTKFNESEDKAVVKFKLKITGREGFSTLTLHTIYDADRGWIVNKYGS